MNNVSIIGNVVNDLELKTTPNGKEYVSFSVAVRRNYKNAEGNYDSDFFPVLVYGATATYLATYGAKGMKVGVSGTLRTRSYVNKDNQNVRVTEIIANGIELMSKPNNGTVPVAEARPVVTPQNVQTRPAYPQNYRTQYQGGVSLSDDYIDSTFGEPEISIPDDSLPF